MNNYGWEKIKLFSKLNDVGRDIQRAIAEEDIIKLRELQNLNNNIMDSYKAVDKKMKIEQSGLSLVK